MGETDDEYAVRCKTENIRSANDYFNMSQKSLEFYKKNWLEIHWQILNRWVIHHHNFVLGPINEYNLGKDPKNIYMQYGFFNVNVMEKLLKAFGGISYQSYFKIWFMFYYLYYLIFLVIVHYIFKDIKYTAVFFILTVGILSKINFQFLYLGPGLTL